MKIYVVIDREVMAGVGNFSDSIEGAYLRRENADRVAAERNRIAREECQRVEEIEVLDAADVSTISDDAHEEAVLAYLWTLKTGDRVKDIERPKLGYGVVAGHMANGFPLILWSDSVTPTAAGLGTRPSDEAASNGV